jgi:hypothetical protein
VQDLQALIAAGAADSNLRAAEFLRSRFVRLSDPALVALARLSRRRSCPIVLLLNDCHRPMALLAWRVAVARWLAQAAERACCGHCHSRLRLRLQMRAGASIRRANVKKVRARPAGGKPRGMDAAASRSILRRCAGDESSHPRSRRLSATDDDACRQRPGVPHRLFRQLQAQGRGRSGGIHVIERGPGNEPEVIEHEGPGWKINAIPRASPAATSV